MAVIPFDTKLKKTGHTIRQEAELLMLKGLRKLYDDLDCMPEYNMNEMESIRKLVAHRHNAYLRVTRCGGELL
jgi:hypothetical protein